MRFGWGPLEKRASAKEARGDKLNKERPISAHVRFRKFWLASLTLTLATANPHVAASQTPSEAQELQSRGDWKGAEEVWRRLLQQDASDYRLWASLGVVLSQEHRYDDAVAAYKRALALAPHDGPTELNLGIAWFKSGHLSDAAAAFQSAAKSLGDSPRLDVLLGMSLYGTGHYRAATPYLERASLQQPSDAELQRTLTQNYLQSGEYDKAMETARKILLERPESAQAHILLGEAYDAANREEQAIVEFRAATQGNYVPNAHFGLGYLLWKARSYDEAAAEFRKELEHDPANSQALAYLGDIVLKQGDEEKAEAMLRHSIALRDDNHVAFVDLAIIETGRKQYQLAERHLQRAIALNSSEADGHYRLAKLYQLTGRPAEAKRQFALVKQVQQHNTDDLIFKVSRDAQIPLPAPVKP